MECVVKTAAVWRKGRGKDARGAFVRRGETWFAFDKEGGYLPQGGGRKRKQGEKGEPRRYCCDMFCVMIAICMHPGHIHCTGSHEVCDNLLYVLKFTTKRAGSDRAGTRFWAAMGFADVCAPACLRAYFLHGHSHVLLHFLLMSCGANGASWVTRGWLSDPVPWWSALLHASWNAMTSAGSRPHCETDSEGLVSFPLFKI